MKPPYQQGTKEWKVWQWFIGQGHSPEQIIAGLKNEPQNQKIARTVLKDINDNYLSGMFAKSAQMAAGEAKPGAAKPTATSKGGINFDATVPPSWQRINWPQGTTGVQMTSPGMGVMTVGKSRYSFHLKGGRPRIDARL